MAATSRNRRRSRSRNAKGTPLSKLQGWVRNLESQRRRNVGAMPSHGVQESAMVEVHKLDEAVYAAQDKAEQAMAALRETLKEQAEGYSLASELGLSKNRPTMHVVGTDAFMPTFDDEFDLNEGYRPGQNLIPARQRETEVPALPRIEGMPAGDRDEQDGRVRVTMRRLPRREAAPIDTAPTSPQQQQNRPNGGLGGRNLLKEAGDFLNARGRNN